MKTTEGWGWLTAGVLALGLNGFYQDGGAAWAHRIVDGAVEQVAERTGAVVELASVRVDRFMETADVLATRDQTASCRLATAMARIQTRMERTQSGMARFEAMSARQEAALTRAEADRVRIEEQVAHVDLVSTAFHSAKIPLVVCPRVRVEVPRVSVPRLPVVRIPAPVVHVEVVGAGPV
jgi:hypothetical protein